MARAPSSSPEIFAQTRRLTLISCTPYIAQYRLRSYLNLTATGINMVSPGSPERIELVAAAYRMVVHDLGDSARLEGMEWWSDWRARFEGTELLGIERSAKL